MGNKYNALTSNRKELAKRVMLAALVMAVFAAFSISPIVSVVSANVAGQMMGGVMAVVFQIVETAALYIGAIIAIWGVFQIILAFRREDSEGIGKQVTTVVVGAILVSFKFLLPMLRKAMGI